MAGASIIKKKSEKIPKNEVLGETLYPGGLFMHLPPPEAMLL
jgi:hypothetical protein